MIGRSLRIVSVIGLVAASVVVLPTSAVAAVTPAPNPTIAKECGIDLTLILDASGSVSQSHAVENVRDAGDAFLSALQDTNSTARVIQFATAAEELAGRQLIDADSMDQTGAFGQAIADYYNPKPPVSGLDVYRLEGDPTVPGGWSRNSSDQYTNWQQALKVTAEDIPKLVVFVTDGDPTAYDFDRSGDPFYDGSTPFAIGIGTDRNSQGAAITLDRAVEAANTVKGNGSRILTIGVGNALNNQNSVNRLIQVSGPNVARSAAEFDVGTTDVALVPNFDNLAAAVRAVVLDLCSPSLTIRKFAQTAGSSAYEPSAGWDFTTTPTVTSGSFDWVLPAGATGPSQTVPTDTNGFAQFQWEPTDRTATSTATVSELIEPGYTAGRPDATDVRCEAKDANNNTRVITSEFAVSGENASFNLDPIGNEIVTCSVWNSFNYNPQIAITKVDDPTVIRGDLDPGQSVTSTYQVTNPGNTPLNQVNATDDQCGPATGVPASGPNQGDTGPQNGLLDPGETWTFSCTRTVQGGGGTSPETIPNTATAGGFDPRGVTVTATDTAEVTAYTPGISVTKQVNGQKLASVELTDPPTPVTYTYAVTNTGNTPLGSVTLGDDHDPCTTPARGPDTPPGNDDDILDVGETWNYTCTAAPPAPVLNIATVTGTPLNPTDPAIEFPGPEVTDTDFAAVLVTDPGLLLSKSVDQNLVLSGSTVTYTYRATNTGNLDLRNDTGDPDWVTDDTCPDVVATTDADGFNIGDTNHDNLLNTGTPGETWTFTCSMPVSELTVNEAEIIAQPVVAGQPVGDELTRHDFALVNVLTAGIAVEKTSTRPVVLSLDAAPTGGPDVPTKRPASYVYEVSNTGTAPLDEVTLTDDRCEMVVEVTAGGNNVGDTDGDGLLDPDEVWSFQCTTSLPGAGLGNQSAQVTNTATATGTPTLPGTGATGEPVTGTDTADTTVIHPGLEVTKTPSQDVVRAGKPVTYTITVRNTGDVPLDLAGLNDDKCEPLQYVDGDANGNGLIDGVNDGEPETFTVTCTRTLGLPPAPETEDVNTVTALVVDPLGNGYTDQATATVHVIDPAIDLVKSVSNNLVPVGGAVTYGFDVTNIGNSPIPADDVLARVNLVDVSEPVVPECSSPALISRTGGNDDDLLDREPAETWHYECRTTITEPTTDLAVVAAIGGTTFNDPELERPVVAFDAAFAQPFHPGISVEKSADPTELGSAGGPVTYTYTVRNTGDVPLADVASRITDDTCSPVSYVSGDDDGDGLLDTPTSLFEDALDETWVFTCSTTVSVTTTNTVTVTGTPSNPDGGPLCGPDSEDPTIPPCDTTGTGTAVVEVAGVPPTPEGPQPTPGGTLPDTGASGIGTMLTTGAIAVMLGGLLIALARRRQIR